jgi:acyl carrier protein
MTDAELRTIVIDELTRVAPELDPATIRLDAPLRDQVDLDSMDFLHLVIALHGRLGVDIPESDYARLSSVGTIVGYLAQTLIPGKVSP